MFAHLLLSLARLPGAHSLYDSLVLDSGYLYSPLKCEDAELQLVPLRIEIPDDLLGALVLGHRKQQFVQLIVGSEPFA